ncbi:MAG TPA: Clp1/GlmU family protein [Allosphingosinicella sp.]|jgi:polynucleotide 5'-kinase involved in rRNA processing
MLDLPSEWEEALARAEAAKRVAVIGPADSGKSAFVSALAGRRPECRVIDLDPGQKMIGPPGTVSLGRLSPERRVDRIVFLGSTSVGSFKALAAAAADLARRARRGFVANTSGYVAGPGAALQAMTLNALRPELVVAIAAPPSFDRLLAKWPAVRLGRSPSARPKPPGLRRATRQAAFAEALAGACERTLREPAWEPGPPRPTAGGERPVCAVADASGEDRAIGILLSPERLLTRFRGVAGRIRLGRLWAVPGAEGWTLIERLQPAWEPR